MKKYSFIAVLAIIAIPLSINHNNDNRIPPLRAHHALVYDEANRSVFLTAGSTPLNGGQSFAIYNDCWRFNGQQWQQTGAAGDQRSGIRLAYDSKEHKIYSFGGWIDGNSLSDLRVFENGNWKTVSQLPGMKASEPGFVYDSDRDRFIVFGGSPAFKQVNNETWEWDRKSWKKIEGPGPEGRQAFAMVYDSKRKKTILFGGMAATPETIFSNTWEFDGAKWTMVNETGPGKRLSPGCAYDSKRGLLIVFGGNSDKGITNETWAWDGSAWKQLAASGPVGRSMGYMAYDKDRDRIVLFGGRKGWPNDCNDTWEWDGLRWEEKKFE
jgi:hypothetical protein